MIKAPEMKPKSGALEGTFQRRLTLKCDSGWGCLPGSSYLLEDWLIQQPPRAALSAPAGSAFPDVIFDKEFLPLKESMEKT